jgi:imidazoleglycerol-phosphate dehydratase
MSRATKETDITVDFAIDGQRQIEINTGIGFLDHMLTSFAFHGGFDLTLECTGDLGVDDHHTVEDIGIVLGEVFREALGDAVGIKRFSNMMIPMDESLAGVTVDLSNRPYLVYNVNFERERIGTMDTQNFKEFFQAFATAARITLHINLMYGENEHHKIEAIFKAFAKALSEASRVESADIVSTKGVL